MRQSEHVLYITLIDFLLQLLFLGMVISVIYAISQQDEESPLDPVVAKDAIEAMEKVKNLTGISNLTQLTDELTRLGPLQPANNNLDTWKSITEAVKNAGGTDAAKKILEKQAGQGLPSCLPNKARLATFHAYLDHIDLGKYDAEEFPALLTRIGVQKSSVERIPRTEFPNVFRQVRTHYPDCRFNIELIEHSFDTRPRDSVRQVFMPIPVPAADRR